MQSNYTSLVKYYIYITHKVHIQFITSVTRQTLALKALRKEITNVLKSLFELSALTSSSNCSTAGVHSVTAKQSIAYQHWQH